MRLLIVAMALAAGGVLLPAAPAGALSCVGPEVVLRDAPSVFAGRILAWDEERVSIAVEEVWKGAAPRTRVAYEVDLAGWWEMDLFSGRTPAGQRFVFAPSRGSLNPCTTFRLSGPMADDVRAFRPPAPGAPVPTSTEAPQVHGVRADRPAPAWALWSGVVVLLGLVAAGAVRWRRLR